MKKIKSFCAVILAASLFFGTAVTASATDLLTVPVPSSESAEEENTIRDTEKSKDMEVSENTTSETESISVESTESETENELTESTEEYVKESQAVKETSETGSLTSNTNEASKEHAIEYLDAYTDKNPKVYTENSGIIPLLPPEEKEGYVFENWYLSDNAGNEKKVITEIDTSLYKNKIYILAVWSYAKYDVIYNANGGKGTMKKETFLCNNPAYLSKNRFTRQDYSFTGWNTRKDGKGDFYTDEDGVSDLCNENNASITLYAQWKVKKYKINYKLTGGTNSKKNPSSFTHKASASIKMYNPVKKGYTFKGWYKDKKYKTRVKYLSRAGHSNVTLYAKWALNKYKISYKLNGGNKNPNKTSYTVKSNTITLKKPEKAGNTFKGWHSDSKFKHRVKIIKKGSVGNITLYAKWSPKTYSITYVTNRSDISAPKDNPGSYCYGTKTITLKDPVKWEEGFLKVRAKGYEFRGWYTDKNLTKKIKKITSKTTGNLVLYAKWKYTDQANFRDWSKDMRLCAGTEDLDKSEELIVAELKKLVIKDGFDKINVCAEPGTRNLEEHEKHPELNFEARLSKDYKYYPKDRAHRYYIENQFDYPEFYVKKKFTKTKLIGLSAKEIAKKMWTDFKSSKFFTSKYNSSKNTLNVTCFPVNPVTYYWGTSAFADFWVYEYSK